MATTATQIDATISARAYLIAGLLGSASREQRVGAIRLIPQLQAARSIAEMVSAILGEDGSEMDVATAWDEDGDVTAEISVEEYLESLPGGWERIEDPECGDEGTPYRVYLLADGSGIVATASWWTVATVARRDAEGDAIAWRIEGLSEVAVGLA